MNLWLSLGVECLSGPNGVPFAVVYGDLLWLHPLLGVCRRCWQRFLILAGARDCAIR